MFRRHHAYLAIFALALLSRGVYFLELKGSALFSVLLGDGRQYHAWATEIAAGDWVGREVFYQAPLYPYFIAVIQSLFGPEAGPLRVIQMLLGAASCVLVAIAGRRFFTPTVGYAAGMVLALYPPAIFFDGLVQKASLGLFLTSLLLVLLAEPTTEPRRSGMRHGRALLTGLVLGCLALTRENVLILVPILLVWILRPSTAVPWRQRGVRGLLFAAGLAVVLVPVGLRNLAIGGHFQVTTSQLGSNFYIGNNPDADGKYRPLRPGREDARVERRDAVELAEADLGRALSPGEVSRYWLRRSFSYIRSDPWDWSRLLARKALMVANARELVDTESIEVYRDHSRVLRILGFFLHFGTIGPLAVLGVWATRRDWRRLWILYAIALAIAASLVLFYVVARYRFGMVPVVVLFAAAGMVAVFDGLKVRPLRPLVPGLALLAITAVVQNRPLAVLTSPRATTYYNLGVALFERGDDERAQVYLSKALEILPDLADGHYNLGRVLAARGDPGGTIVSYRRALAGDPGHVDARFELARLLAEQGRTPAAAEHYRQVLARQPRHAMAHNNLGYLLILEGRIEEAADHLRAAVAADPELAMAHNLLGNVLAQQGQVAAAIEHYQYALEVDPELADAHFKLGLLLSESGRLEAAQRHLEETIRLLPDFPEAHLRLAIVLERRGRVEEAIREVRRVLELRPEDANAAGHLRRLLEDRQP